MTTTSTIPNIPLPAGAVRALDWESPQHTGFPNWVRYFDGTTRTIELTGQATDVEVTIEGTQYGDGRLDCPMIRVRDVDPDSPLTIHEARELAAALTAAAYEAGGWAR